MTDSNSKLNDRDRRKLLSILAHSSIIFSSTLLSIGVPIAILFLSQDEIVIGNAKEVLNFYISTYILGICCIALTFLVIGIPLLILLWIATMIMPIFAILKVARNSDRIYRYPLTMSILTT